MDNDPFDELGSLLGEQAHKAFAELVFPGQIESHGTTNGPRNWNELPENYRKALNIGLGVRIEDSIVVYKRAKSLLGLKTGDKALLAVHRELRSNIAKLINILQKQNSVRVYGELQKYVQLTEEQPWIERKLAEVALLCIAESSFDAKSLGSCAS